MKKREFKGMIHYLHKRMVDITFPTTKTQMKLAIGDQMIRVDFDTEVSIGSLLDTIEMEEFTCGAQFYSALLGSL